jgi:hypothetical protein
MTKECSCTQDSDCERCKSLVITGYNFIDASGEEGVGVLLEERDRLQVIVSSHEKALRETVDLKARIDNLELWLRNLRTASDEDDATIEGHETAMQKFLDVIDADFIYYAEPAGVLDAIEAEFRARLEKP